jgi:hypothetical protein
MEIKALQILNSSSLANNPKLIKNGCLAYELATDRASVAIKLTKAIYKAAGVFGISLDSEKASFTINEIITKVVKDYPNAFIDDICLAIELASFGEIKLENQLTTISAHNVFMWYKEFRMNHSHKSSKAFTVNREDTTESEPSEAEKYKIKYTAFERFMNDPINNEIGMVLYYDVMVKIGAIEVPSPTDRQNAYLELALEYSNSIPVDLLMKNELRRKAYEFADYVKEYDKANVFRYDLWDKNPLHERVVRECKSRIILKTIKEKSPKTILELYKSKYQV